MPFQDPAHYPDPYPFRHTHNVPHLDSAGSSSPSTSTRSSAYTNSGSALAYFDNNNVHVASPEEHAHGITSDALAQMLATDPAASSSARGPSLRSPDRARWSDAYSSSVRSRSSSIGNGAPVPHPADNTSPRQVNQKPSYDVSWQTVNETEETEEETDDEHALDIDHLDDDHQLRTAAAVVADEGRGLIVQGDNVPIVQLQVQPGTTHMLIGSSPTPNAVPAFLTSTLPQIAHSLLALDISANFLGALPPVLAVCENLEELNVASNPLRVLPVFLANLSNLCVLIADSTGISTLPDALVDLEKLHTISVRRNKLHALPSWLCLLPALQTLCVDGNPFQGPWKALVDPLLAKVPTTPAYPPSTPMMPLSASLSSNADTEHDPTDADDYSDPEVNSTGHSPQSLEEEDHTITPERAPLMTRSTTSPFPVAVNVPPVPQSRALTRTRTTPNRSYFDQTRAKSNQPTPDPPLPRQFAPAQQPADPHHRGDHEIRKMKSAGDLRRGKSATATAPQDSQKPNLVPNHPGSLSSSNLLNLASSTNSPAGPSSVDPAYSKRFATLGTNAGFNPSGRPPPNAARPQLSQSMWETRPSSNHIASEPVSRASSFTPSVPPPTSIEPIDRGNQRHRSSREKSSRWGFLKKMSMGKMKTESPTSPTHSPNGSPTPNRIASSGRPHTSAGIQTSQFGSISARGGSKTPQIDLRLSTTGALDGFTLTSTSNHIAQPPATQQQQQQQPSRDLLSPPSTSNNLLAPPTTLRNKRRSFLPLDAPGAMTSLSIPEHSAFVGGVVVSHDNEETDGRPAGPPSPAPTQEQYTRREEDRAREAYMRALRSVMAYLRDMNDLSVSQQTNPLSMYGNPSDDAPIARSRRPTVIDREGSMSASTSDLPNHIRPAESLSGIRSGTSSQTLSVATTDSNGSSGEERKYKDDKGKRTMVVQEIVKTERTYVKGMHELVEIYIKPAATPVHLISSVGSSKETVVPASERKVVFGGIEALFSFHKDNFLPALEEAAAPLMKADGQADADGRLSIEVAKAVGNIFVKHAAFMRMYSSYINNFDSSLQRVKHWTSDRAGTASPGGALSPSSSTAQLAGMGMSMGMTASPGSIAESAPSAASGLPNLTTSQRKKIKAYLKRCRVNPRHTQLNLEGYLLLPVQRIPRYKLLLEELLRSTPPTYEYMDDPLDRALAEISLLANNMNEGKRESESRRKLVQWQTRIRGKFPSPLVQPHRRLIMDGPLLLTRVVRKAVVSFEAINAQGDASTVQVDCLAPELTPRQLIGILCNDLLVLCRDPSEGQDVNSPVDLWAVLRMQTLPQPASIVHGNALRLVDNKAILYFDAPSPSDALNWYRAINLHIPASKA